MVLTPIELNGDWRSLSVLQHADDDGHSRAPERTDCHAGESLDLTSPRAIARLPADPEPPPRCARPAITTCETIIKMSSTGAHGGRVHSTVGTRARFRRRSDGARGLAPYSEGEPASNRVAVVTSRRHASAEKQALPPP